MLGDYVVFLFFMTWVLKKKKKKRYDMISAIFCLY